MANPTSIEGLNAVLEATTTQQEILLQSDREYTLRHLGQDTGGSPATEAIYVGLNSSTSDADNSEGASKIVLKNGSDETFGPGVTQIAFKTSSGSPTFAISPWPRRFGKF